MVVDPNKIDVFDFEYTVIVNAVVRLDDGASSLAHAIRQHAKLERPDDASFRLAVDLGAALLGMNRAKIEEQREHYAVLSAALDLIDTWAFAIAHEGRVKDIEAFTMVLVPAVGPKKCFAIEVPPMLGQLWAVTRLRHHLGQCGCDEHEPKPGGEQTPVPDAFREVLVSLALDSLFGGKE